MWILFNDFHFDQNVLNLEVWYFKVHAISFINSFFLYSYSFRIHWHKAGTYNFFPTKYSLMQKEVAYWICTLDFPCEKIKMRKRLSFALCNCLLQLIKKIDKSISIIIFSAKKYQYKLPEIKRFENCWNSTLVVYPFLSTIKKYI